jgi:TPR repeat protein
MGRGSSGRTAASWSAPLAVFAAALGLAASAQALDPDKETGPSGLSRLLAAEASAPSAALEYRIAELYGPGPADIGPGGLAKGARGPEGVPVDYGQAMLWLRRAARHCNDGDADAAKFQIGDLYAYGAGVPQDRVQALTWYLITTRLGKSGLHGEYVDGMRAALSRAQQAAAARRARNYLADERRRCGN